MAGTAYNIYPLVLYRSVLTPAKECPSALDPGTVIVLTQNCSLASCLFKSPPSSRVAVP